jgi:succinoglycan biosynthesis transport protein ExoP
VELHFYTSAIRRYWRSVAAVLLIGALLGAAFALLRRPTYTATAQAYISTGTATNLSELSQGNAYTEQVVASYAHIVTTGYVLRAVIHDLGLHRSVETLAKEVEPTIPPGTSVLEVAVSDPSPGVATSVANAIVARLQSTVSDLTDVEGGQSGLVRLTRIETASVPVAPSSPAPVVLVGAGALAGLVLGLVLAVLRRITDVRIRSPHELAAAAAAPVLGEVPFDHEATRRPLVVAAVPTGIDAEAYRSLGTNLLYLDPDARIGSVVITSAGPGRGKSVLSANLAIALADTERRIVLVDADLRRPAQAALFGLEGDIGLSDVLVGRVALDAALQTTGTGVSVLPAGKIPPNPVRLLESDAMGRLIETLKERFDVIVFDTPPLLAASDAALLTLQADGALLADSVRGAKRPELRRAVEALALVDARLLGVVATMVSRRDLRAYEYVPGQPNARRGTSRRAGSVAVVPIVQERG